MSALVSKHAAHVEAKDRELAKLQEDVKGAAEGHASTLEVKLP